MNQQKNTIYRTFRLSVHVIASVVEYEIIDFYDVRHQSLHLRVIL